MLVCSVIKWQIAASEKGLEDCWEREQKDVSEREGREWLCPIQNRWDVVDSVSQEVGEGRGLDEDCAVGEWADLTARGNGQNTSLNPHVVHFTQQRTAVIILYESEPERLLQTSYSARFLRSIIIVLSNSNLFQSEESNDKTEKKDSANTCWTFKSSVQMLICGLSEGSQFTMVVCNSWKGRSA